MGQVCTDVWVEGGHKRRAWGRGGGGGGEVKGEGRETLLEHLLQTVDINGNQKRNLWKCEVTFSRSHSA